MDIWHLFPAISRRLLPWECSFFVFPYPHPFCHKLPIGIPTKLLTPLLLRHTETDVDSSLLFPSFKCMHFIATFKTVSVSNQQFPSFCSLSMDLGPNDAIAWVRNRVHRDCRAHARVNFHTIHPNGECTSRHPIRILLYS